MNLPEVKLSEDGLSVVLKLNDEEVTLADYQIAALIEQLQERQRHAKALRMGYILKA